MAPRSRQAHWSLAVVGEVSEGPPLLGANPAAALVVGVLRKTPRAAR